MRKTEHCDHCRRIANELETIARGEMYFCPSCNNEQYEKPDFTECPNCGEELEQYSLYDYIGDALDIDYIIQSDRKTVKGVRILIAFGGPNIYIDTLNHEVSLKWWTESGEAHLEDFVCDDLNEIAEELFNC